MEIKQIKRPWIRNTQKRYQKDAFYQSKTWKSTKESFKDALPTIRLPLINGKQYNNNYCADCWEKGIINAERIEIDHVIAIKDGGSKIDHINLRSRCHSHHNGKTHKERKIRVKNELPI